MKITTGLKPARFITAAITLALPFAYANAVTELNTINVTATRTAQTVDETLASVTVITRDDIDKLQDHDLVSLLDGLPGLTISSSGGLGKVTGLRLRGTDSGHVLVLIDGIRISSATAGQTAFEHLPLAQIERIEIVRGPLSHLYGADAIGGVIQIFTRQGQQGMQINAKTGYGSHNTTNSSLSISGADNNTHYSLSISQLKSDGFNALKGNDPDKDGYRNQSLTTTLGHQFGNGLKLKINVLHADGNSEYDGFFATSDYSADFVQQAISSKLEYSPAEWWDLSLTLGESKDETTGFTNGSVSYFIDTKQRQLSWQNNFIIDDESILTLGVDLLRDRVDSSTAYTEDQRENTGVFFQYQRAFGAHNLAIALRHDDSDAFENHGTGNITWGYHLSNGLQINASYGTAFKAPSFMDLYFPFGFGNPNLSPEQSKSMEVGVRGKHNWGHWSLNAFRTDITDLISFTGFTVNNVDKARINGLETSISSTLADWNIAGHLTLLDPRNTRTNKLLPRRHKRTLRIDINRTFGKTNLGATLQARSYNFDNTANTQRVSGFATVDLRASHKLYSNWHIQAEISNLFNKDYEVIRNYNTDDRSAFVSISYQSK